MKGHEGVGFVTMETIADDFVKRYPCSGTARLKIPVSGAGKQLHSRPIHYSRAGRERGRLRRYNIGRHALPFKIFHCQRAYNRPVAIETFWDATGNTAIHILGCHTHQLKQSVHLGYGRPYPAAIMSGQKITYEYADTGVYRCEAGCKGDFGTGCSGYDTAQVRIIYNAGIFVCTQRLLPWLQQQCLTAIPANGKWFIAIPAAYLRLWGQSAFENFKTRWQRFAQ